MKGILGVIAGCVVAVVAGALSTGSAGSSLCPSSRACIYTDNNYIGLLGYKSGGSGLSNVSAGANDKTDSWENKTSSNGRWYYDVNAGGNCYNMASHTENPNLGWAPSDELSSWAMNGLCP
jgi:hypothetical protein